MNISKQEILEKLAENNGSGYVELSGLLHEIKLLNGNQIAFTGACWKWTQTEMPSAHGDYSVLTDVLVEEDLMIPRFPTQDYYEFYESVHDFS
ncbi:hypothetical protein E1I69_13600 [Bacillus timonensis]|uniref:Uncharacterized protein n=1 Tax=Bacillus timonensis TaxID=1033734 RepID=A0A4S3PRC1_9BACI|nr:hypothetical protein [Bacillus timonensis]THE11796.1 hypothetical protein E1I69_13600 [Bacillus timonensis]